MSLSAHFAICFLFDRQCADTEITEPDASTFQLWKDGAVIFKARSNEWRPTSAVAYSLNNEKDESVQKAVECMDRLKKGLNSTVSIEGHFHLVVGPQNAQEKKSGIVGHLRYGANGAAPNGTNITCPVILEQGRRGQLKQTTSFREKRDVFRADVTAQVDALRITTSLVSLLFSANIFRKCGFTLCTDFYFHKVTANDVVLDVAGTPSPFTIVSLTAIFLPHPTHSVHSNLSIFPPFIV